VRTLWAIVLAICLIASGASRARVHHEDHRDPREAKHAALRVITAGALIAAPGRPHGQLDDTLVAVAVAAPALPPPPRAVIAGTTLATRPTPGVVDATAYRSRAPPLDSVPS
jgi:hypothetical protein